MEGGWERGWGEEWGLGWDSRSVLGEIGEGAEGQENEWKSAAGGGGGVGLGCISSKSQRDLGWGRLRESMEVSLVEMPKSGVREPKTAPFLKHPN